MTRSQVAKLELQLVAEEKELKQHLLRECVRLREVVGLQTENSVGAIFLEACQENASRDPQRRGPRKLASWVLQALSHDT